MAASDYAHDNPENSPCQEGGVHRWIAVCPLLGSKSSKDAVPQRSKDFSLGVDARRRRRPNDACYSLLGVGGDPTAGATSAMSNRMGQWVRCPKHQAQSVCRIRMKLRAKLGQRSRVEHPGKRMVPEQVTCQQAAEKAARVPHCSHNQPVVDPAWMVTNGITHPNLCQISRSNGEPGRGKLSRDEDEISQSIS